MSVSITTNLPLSSYVKLAQTLTLSIQATSTNPPLSYSWTKDGSSVGTNSNILQITSVNEYNQGAYYCTVTDGNSSTATSNTCNVLMVDAKKLNMNPVYQTNSVWTMDLSNETFSRGTIVNEDVIDQSITNILTTFYGERLFNPTFGCGLMGYLFNNSNTGSMFELKREVILALNKWEPRITIDESSLTVSFNQDNNQITLAFNYLVKKTSTTQTFLKKIGL